MGKSRQRILDEFGQLLMSEVRDTVCEIIDNLVAGKGRGEIWKNLSKDLRKIKLKPEEVQVVKRLAVQAVDQTIFKFLTFLDSYEIGILFPDQQKEGEVHDISKISDGLPGEPLAE